MESIYLGVFAFSATDEEFASLANTLSLAIECGDIGWSLVETANANLQLVWVNSEHDIALVANLKHEYPAEQLIVIARDNFPVQTYWHLAYPQDLLVPGVLSIANLFSRIHAYFSLGLAEAADSFIPDEALPGIIQTSLNDGLARICSYPACPELYLLPKEQFIYLNGPIESLLPMALADWQSIDVVEVSDQKVLETVSYVQFSSRLSQYMFLEEDTVLGNISETNYKRYTFNELIGFAVLVASRGRLMDGNSWTTTVWLRQMPDAMHLDGYGKDYRAIAECMVAQALTLHEIATRTKRSLFEVIGFYNACAALKLIEQGEGHEPTAPDFFEEWPIPNMASGDTVNDIDTFSTNPPTEQPEQTEAALTSFFEDWAPSLIASEDTVPDPVSSRSKLSLTGRLKIVVSGSLGAGKTTAINTLSDCPPISTEIQRSDASKHKKATTTVAMDYGEINIRENLKVCLYGTPGEKRFEFMSEILSDKAWGLLLLIDNTAAHPVDELDYYLTLFEKNAPKLQIAIGITNCDVNVQPRITDYLNHLNQRGLTHTLMPVDARNKASLSQLLEGLIAATV